MSGHGVHLLAAAVILITVCSYNLQQINALTSEPECGVRNLISRRIVGGVEAEDHEFPWMVYLQAGTYACGGAILDKRHILTAAHCLLNQTNTTVPTSYGDCYYDKREWKFDDLSQIYVGVGSSILSKLERYGVLSINIDGRYVTGTKDYDVAVVTLDRDLVYTDRVKPICLPESGQEHQGPCIIAGWGATEYSSTVVPQLRKTPVDIVNRTYCSELYKQNIEKNKVCAGILGKAGACKGDSGGPLMCEVDNRYFTFGVISFVYNKTCTTEAPTVFTKVSDPAVLTFIKQGMKVTNKCGIIYLHFVSVYFVIFHTFTIFN